VTPAPIDAAKLDDEGMALFAADAYAAAKREGMAGEMAARWISICAANRIALERRLAESPALRNTPITKPVFIVSGARTGSTLLQRLLALDPALRSPHLWELWRPSSPGGAGERRAGVAEARARLKHWPKAALALHPMAPDEPDECHWILRHNVFRATLHLAWNYWDWLKRLDRAQLGALLGLYKTQVQIMQANAPGRRWLSKTFSLTHYWPAFFDVFPDASVIRIHRDPRHSIASSCSLMQSLSRSGDPAAFGAISVEIAADGAARVMNAPPPPATAKVIDVAYEDLCAAPAEVAAALAGEIGLEPNAFRERATAYLESDHAVKAAPHAYALEDFRLDESEIAERFAPYMAWAKRATAR
jgi:hypothetical protein